jgi:alginate O-acetyltransferase complex protein AlgJ
VTAVGDDGDAGAAVTEPVDWPTGPIDVHESFLHEAHPLHRPRHGRHVGSGVAAVVFLLVPAVVLVLGVRPVAFENRALAAFPSVTEGWGFLGGLPPWASDHLPLRREAVQAADGISTGVFGEPFPLDQPSGGGPASVGAVAGPVAPVVPGQQMPGAAGGAPSPTTAKPQVNDDFGELRRAGFPIVVTGRDGWLYYGFDAYATCYPSRPLGDVVNRLQRLRSAVEGSGRSFTLIVAPDKSTVVPQHLPDSYAGSSCVLPRREQFWSVVTTQAGALDLRPELGELSRSAPAYSPLDTHWSFGAAEVVTRAIAENVEPGSTSRWTTTAGALLLLTGDLSTLAGSPGTFSLDVPRLRIAGVDVTREPQFHYYSPITLGLEDPQPPDHPTRWAVVGDSFAQYATPYIAGAAPGSTLVHVQTARSDPRGVARSMAGGRAVVLEVSERYLDSGVSPALDDAFIAAVEGELAADPVR